MEIRFWQDYFNSLGQSIVRLGEVVNHPEINKNDYMQDAAIQRFEFVIELFWKVLKKVLAYEKVDATTPRDVISKAYQFKLIDNEDIWLKMLTDRNNTSLCIQTRRCKPWFKNIKTYLPIFENTYKKIKEKYKLPQS